MNLEEIIGEELTAKHLTMGTAESCTGGTIASQITSVAGSSVYFKGSVVAYCNEIKHKVLGVSESDLDAYGAVSQPVVEQMALGVIKLLGCDCAVATSGIAGPGGGTPYKPIGMVWIAAVCKNTNKVLSKCFQFGTNNRAENIRLSTDNALQMLRKVIIESY